jgi:hypothetical protein
VRRVVGRAVAGVLVALVALAGCTSPDSGPGAADPTSAPSSPTKTLTLPPPSEKPLSGTLTAELQQSSRDVALGRFQVWITNGLDHQIRPRRIVYRDGLLTQPVMGGRLRPIPSGSYRGYTLDLVEPRCGRDVTAGVQLTVDFREDVLTIPVADETKVVGRWAEERCSEIAVERIAPLEWTSGIRIEGSGPDAVALFRLTAHPTGATGSYTVDTVGGTPLFTSADGDFWTVDEKVDGRGQDVTMELPAQPARCDAHAFGAATGGTTFFVNVTIGKDREAQIRLAMSPAVTAEAFAYAAEACGWDK